MVIVQYVLQYFIAAVLFATALGKLLDVPGFVRVLKTYRSLPQWALQPAAAGLVLVELYLAAWLAVGQALALAALGSVVLHVVFTVWSAVTLLRKIDVPNCGCFGVFFARRLTWRTVAEDVFMLAVSAALYVLAIQGA